MLQRGEGDCMIQEQIRKRMLEKEKMLEAVINKRDSEIERLHKDLLALENENVDFFDTNTAQNEELKVQRDQIRKLNQQIDVLQQTISILKEETNNIDSMRKELVALLFLSLKIFYRSFLNRYLSVRQIDRTADGE